MPRKLWPSLRPRGTLSGNSYYEEQLVRRQPWLTFGKKHEQWYRSKIRRVSPFSCFQGQLGSGNDTVTFALGKASCKPGAALCFCGLSLEGEDYSGATTWVPRGAWPALLIPAFSEQDWLRLSWPGSKTSSAGGLSHGPEPSYSSVRASPALAQLAHRQPNRLHQAQVSWCVDIFSSTHSLGFPLSEFHLCSH